jgi:hypothetical protein
VQLVWWSAWVTLSSRWSIERRCTSSSML